MPVVNWIRVQTGKAYLPLSGLYGFLPALLPCGGKNGQASGATSVRRFPPAAFAPDLLGKGVGLCPAPVRCPGCPVSCSGVGARCTRAARAGSAAGGPVPAAGVGKGAEVSPPRSGSFPDPVIDIPMLDHAVCPIPRHDDMVKDQDPDSVQQLLKLDR